MMRLRELKELSKEPDFSRGTGEWMIFITAHAINIMVMHHANEWLTRIYKGLNQVQICHFMDVNRIGNKLLQRIARRVRITALGYGKAIGENSFPEILTFACGR